MGGAWEGMGGYGRGTGGHGRVWAGHGTAYDGSLEARRWGSLGVQSNIPGGGPRSYWSSRRRCPSGSIRRSCRCAAGFAAAMVSRARSGPTYVGTERGPGSVARSAGQAVSHGVRASHSALPQAIEPSGAPHLRADHQRRVVDVIGELAQRLVKLALRGIEPTEVAPQLGAQRVGAQRRLQQRPVGEGELLLGLSVAAEMVL